MVNGALEMVPLDSDGREGVSSGASNGAGTVTEAEPQLEVRDVEAVEAGVART